MLLIPLGINARTYKGTITIEVGERYYVDLGYNYATVSGYWSRSNSNFRFVSQGMKTCEIEGLRAGTSTLSWWGFVNGDKFEFYWNVEVKSKPTVVEYWDYFITDDGFLFQVTDWAKKTCQIGWRNPENPDDVSYQNGITDKTRTGRIVIPSTASGKTISDRQVSNFTVTGVASSAFARCENLTEIVLPSTIRSVGDYAFYSCSSLTSMTLPQTLEEVPKSLFRDCSKLKNVTLPNNATVIGENCFLNCTELEKLELPAKLDSIGRCAFLECTSLSSITIPNDISFVGDGAFEGTPWYDNLPEDGIVYIGKVAYDCKGTLPDYVEIREGTTHIVEDAFGGYSVLMYKFPASLTSIGNYAFSSGNYFLQAIQLSSPYPIAVSEKAFLSDNSSREDFYNRVRLYVPVGSLSRYKEADFWKNFKNICELDRSPLITIAEGKDKQMTYLITGGTTCQVFDGKSAKGDVRIPETADGFKVTGIGYRAFYKNEEISSIVIPQSVTYTGSAAFTLCTGLTSLEIPSSLVSIADGTFTQNQNLTSIVVDAANPVYDSRGNCNAIIETVSNTLKRGCKTTTIPSTIKKIGYAAFSGAGLEVLVIPDNVEEIERAAFTYNELLKTVTLGRGIRVISGEKAFGNIFGGSTDKLESIYSLNEYPNDLYEWAFLRESNEAYYETITLYVPTGSRDRYMAATGWNKFTHVEEFNPSIISDVLICKDFEVSVYSLSGQRLAAPKKGINIIGGRKVMIK